MENNVNFDEREVTVDTDHSPKLRPHLVLILLLSVVFSFDFITRFQNDINFNGPVSSFDVPLSVFLAQLALKDHQEYLVKLNGLLLKTEDLGQSVVDETAPAIVSTDWLVGELQVRLLGVFQSEDSFAVLKRINLETSFNDLVEVNVGDEIASHFVESISNREILLRDGEGSVVKLKLCDPNVG
jgi:hypothetical protein